MSKKRNNKESTNCLTPKPSQKNISEIIGVSSWSPSCPDHNPLDYTIWGVLENKPDATSHLNFSSLKTAFEEEWNKMSEEFILKVSELFRRRVDTIIEKKKKKKWWPY